MCTYFFVHMVQARNAVIEGSKHCDVNALEELKRSCVKLGESSFDFLDRNVSDCCVVSTLSIYQSYGICVGDTKAYGYCYSTALL